MNYSLPFSGPLYEAQGRQRVEVGNTRERVGRQKFTCPFKQTLVLGSKHWDLWGAAGTMKYRVSVSLEETLTQKLQTRSRKESNLWLLVKFQEVWKQCTGEIASFPFIVCVSRLFALQHFWKQWGRALCNKGLMASATSPAWSTSSCVAKPGSASPPKQSQ